MVAWYRLIILPAFLICNCWGLHVVAQRSINTAGGDTGGQAGSVSFSIGQVDYAAFETLSGSAYLGVQQPYDPAGPEDFTETACFAHPNPTSGILNLVVQDPDFLSFSFVLYDLLGKVHRRAANMNVGDSIQLDDLSAGVYILRIRNNLNQVWNCRIIKVSL